MKIEKRGLGSPGRLKIAFSRFSIFIMFSRLPTDLSPDKTLENKFTCCVSAQSVFSSNLATTSPSYQS